jgi:3-methylcrotonyl-CoA carboxylase alpha subunit
VIGPRTNAAFLAALLRTRGFRTGKFDTGFIENNLATLVPPHEPDLAAAAAGLARLIEREQERIATRTRGDGAPPASPWDAHDGFQLGGTRVVSRRVQVDDAELMAHVSYEPHGPAVSISGKSAAENATLVEADDAVYVLHQGRQTVVRPALLEANDLDRPAGGVLAAPMHGKLLAIAVAKGDVVHKGQRLAILEAMKMEHALLAPFDGTVADVLAAPGNQVAERAPILVIKPKE